MYFRDYYVHMATQKALSRQNHHFYIHEPYLRRTKRPSLLLHRFGRFLEQAGKSLQARYSSAPGMAQ